MSNLYREHGRHAPRGELVETPVDVLGRAHRHVVDHPAPERLGCLDAQRDGEFPVRGDRADVLRRAGDPEPAPPGTAVLGVDMGLHPLEVVHLPAQLRHLVARGARGHPDPGERLAEHAVGHKMVGEHPQSPAPRPLYTDVVGLFVQL
ncbi:hypothetical protein [Dietzia kunjamensis]|uniref:hypothetical protein n=1 Tax=Dietzia kunjamensis TaxID=322509 RepID=UPI0039BD6CC2